MWCVISIATTLALLFGLGTVGCSPLIDAAAGGSASSSTATPTPLMVVTVSTTYEGGETETVHGTCTAPGDAAVGTEADCSLFVPEGQLYYSDLNITLDVPEGSPCDLVFFQAYYYQASNQAGFTPSWSESTIDCSVADPPIDCYSGAATEMISDFPTFRGIFMAPGGAATSQVFSATSANSRLRGSNRYTSNDLALGIRSNDVAPTTDGYVGDSMRDYTFVCSDKWLATQYQITLYILEEDDESGVFPDGDENDRSSWSHLD